MTFDVQSWKDDYETLFTYPCCLHSPLFHPDQVRTVLAWAHSDVGSWKSGPKQGTDSESISVLRLDNGKYAALEECEELEPELVACDATPGELLRGG